MTRKGIRQQNAERRLSHARWETQPTVAPEAWLLVAGVAAALFVLIFFAVRP